MARARISGGALLAALALAAHAADAPRVVPADDLLARRCAAGIAERMPELEPIGGYTDVGPGLLPGERAVRVDVRLSDSFRAKPVGVVECEVNPTTRTVRVTKVRK